MLLVSSAILSAPLNPKLVGAFSFSKAKTITKPYYALNCPFRRSKLRVSARRNELPESETRNVADKGRKLSFDEKGGEGRFDLGWLPAFPHVLVASMSNFIFGYHIGSVFSFYYVSYNYSATF